MFRCLSLFALVFFCFLVPCSIQAQTKTVVFIRYRIAPSYWATVVDGFKAGMTARGFEEGVQVEYVDILTRSADKSSVPDVMAAVFEWRDKADMIVTCGWLSMYARPVLKKTATPQLFVPILKSVAERLVPALDEPPGTNLSGIYVMYPPEKILRLARLVLPDLRHYAYVYDSRIPADNVFKLSYERLDHGDRHGITIHYLDLAGGVDRVLTGLKENKVEAFGGIVGSFQKRGELAASGLPVISAFTLDIDEADLGRYAKEGNIVAGLYNPFRYCGEQAAEMTADIFSGITTIENTVPRPAKQIAFINMKTAADFNIYIPFSALEAVDVVIK